MDYPVAQWLLLRTTVRQPASVPCHDCHSMHRYHRQFMKQTADTEWFQSVSEITSESRTHARTHAINGAKELPTSNVEYRNSK
jgi:hypothetical protein